MTDPPFIVRFATASDGIRIAYAASGDGPPLVFVRALNSHVVDWWDEVRIRPYFEALGKAFTVYRFDARGNGLSDEATEIDIGRLVSDVEAVADGAGLDNFALYGQGFGSPVALAYAARHPDRVAQLIVYCAFARGLPISDAFVETMRVSPRQAHAIMAQDTYPDAEELSARSIRRGVEHSRGSGVAYFDFVRTVDVRGELAAVRAPTLVMHPERSPVVHRRFGIEVAEGIADARFVEIPGGSYNPWPEGVFELTLDTIADFVGASIPQMPNPRPLAVLLTDIVGSTEMTHEIGEERARNVFRAHDAIVKDAVGANGGVEVKHTGDGTMATFAEALGALRAAVRIESRLAADRRPSGDELRVRIGIAFGDVVVERGDLFGKTVMLTVRIANRSSADQILVSESVAEVGRANGFAFAPPRLLSLKGFPGRVRVYELLWS